MPVDSQAHPTMLWASIFLSYLHKVIVHKPVFAPLLNNVISMSMHTCGHRMLREPQQLLRLFHVT